MAPEPEISPQNVAIYDPDRKGIFIHRDQLVDSPFDVGDRFSIRKGKRELFAMTLIKDETGDIFYDKKGIFRHRDWTEIVPGLGPGRKDVRVRFNGIVFNERFAVDVNRLVVAFDDVAGHADNPFNEILLRLYRELKNNDVSPLGVLERNDHLLQIWQLDAVDKLVDQNVIADQQRVFHRSGGNLEGLHHEGANEKCQQNSHENGFDVLPQPALLPDGDVFF